MQPRSRSSPPSSRSDSQGALTAKRSSSRASRSRSTSPTRRSATITSTTTTTSRRRRAPRSTTTTSSFSTSSTSSSRGGASKRAFASTATSPSASRRPRDRELVDQDYPPGKVKKRQDLTNNYAAELNTRFLPTVYPTKLFVAYQQPSFEVTAGDFYVQLGRGLVFSVRKIDELSIDTTVRGGKVAFDRNFGDVHLGAIAFAGQMNPVRLDETTGRRLNILPGQPLFFGFPTAQDLTFTQLNQIGAAITDESGRATELPRGRRVRREDRGRPEASSSRSAPTPRSSTARTTTRRTLPARTAPARTPPARADDHRRPLRAAVSDLRAERSLA